MCMGFVLLVDGIDNTAGYSLLFSGGEAVRVVCMHGKGLYLGRECVCVFRVYFVL